MEIQHTPSEKNLDFKLKIEANSNKNNSFEIEFIANTFSYIFIQAKQKNNNFLNKTYSNKFPTEKIKENKYFNMFDDLKEICIELSERIKTKGISIFENINDLIISINLPITKYKEIQFNLNEDKKDINQNVINLNNLILELKKENIELKKEVKEIKDNHKKEINEIKNEINNLKEEIKTLMNYKREKEEKKEKVIISNLNSVIINNNIEYNKQLKTWINSNKKVKAELLYRLSRDGENISTFHQLCDNQGPTLTLFYTKDGNKGGIYTPLSWDTTSIHKNDIESFIFNLNKQQKYKRINNGEYSICCSRKYGPWVPCFVFHERNKMKKIIHNGKNLDNFYEKG